MLESTYISNAVKQNSLYTKLKHMYCRHATQQKLSSFMTYSINTNVHQNSLTLLYFNIVELN